MNPALRALLFSVALIACGGAPGIEAAKSETPNPPSDKDPRVDVSPIASAPALTPPAPSTPIAEPAPSEAPAPLKVARFSLENGLDVIVNEDHAETFVAVHVRYRVGSIEDPLGKSGRAHLIEHLMFQGTGDNGEDFVTTIEAIGAKLSNGTTNVDRLALFETVPTPMLDMILRLEAGRVARLASRLDAAIMSGQRDVVKQELKLLAPRNAEARFGSQTLFPAGHPYRQLVAGDAAGLDAITLTDLKTALAKLYVPANTTLVLCGDVDLAGARALVTKHFGAIAKMPALAPRTAKALKLTSNRAITIETQSSAEAIALVWPTPAVYSAGDAELDVIGEILGGAGGRLSARLREDLGITIAPTATEESAALVSQFRIRADVQSGNAAKAIAGVEEAVTSVVSAPPSEDEVAQARARVIAAASVSLVRLHTRAATLADLAAAGKDPTHPEEVSARYARISASDVVKVAKESLAGKAHLIVKVATNPAAPAEGRLAP